MKIVHTKKNPMILWGIIEDTEESVKLAKLDNNQQPTPEEKQIKKTTFKKSYKLLNIGESKEDTTAAQEAPAPPKAPEKKEAATDTPEKPQETQFIYMNKKSGDMYKTEQQLTPDHAGHAQYLPISPAGLQNTNIADLDTMPAEAYSSVTQEDTKESPEVPEPAKSPQADQKDKENISSEVVKQETPAPPKPESNSMRADRDSKKNIAVKKFTPFKKGNYNLRQSMITSYVQCPKKFYAQYEDGLNESSIFTKMGTAIHGALEDVMEIYKVTGGYPDQDKVEAILAKWWLDYGINDKDHFIKYKNMLSDYVQRVQHDDIQIIGIEYEFETEIDGIPLTGTIDRIDRIDEDTIMVVDYKSNMMPFSRADVDESIQFHQYAMALNTPKIKKEMGGFKHVICRYEMLRHGYPQDRVFHDVDNNEDIKNYTEWITILYKKIMEGTDREPSINQYCAFCSIRGNCEAYQAMIVEEVPHTNPEMDLNEIVGAMERLALQKKVVEKEYKNVQSIVKAKISQHDGSVGINDREYYASAKKVDSYNTQDIIRILTMQGLSGSFADVFKVNSAGLKKVIKENPHIADKVESVREDNYYSPQIMSRKLKPKKDE